MNNRHDKERARIRAARYAPGRGFYEVTEMTLRNLPKRKRRSLKNRVLAVSSVAAALALLLVFTAPTLVQAAARLYQRLFGQVVSDIKQEQALPEDEKLKALVAEREDSLREYDVKGATTQIGGVTASVKSIRTTPVDKYNEGDKGELDLWLTYSAIPAFDPSRVDFFIVIDGKEIPMQIDEQFKQYRDEGGQTLTEAQWASEWTLSNSQLWEGVFTTWLSFDIDTWRWDDAKALELKATIDGQPFSIPFEYDPAKAHEAAVESAKISLKLSEENFNHEKDELESMEESAVPVGLTGSTERYEWAISEMSYANEKLYFTAAFGGVTEKNPKLAGMSFWLGDVTVDGMMVGGGSSDNDALEDGNYTAVYQYPLGRDPRNLPEESLIKLTLELGDSGATKDVAFKYNWRNKKASMPKDEAEMLTWVKDAEGLKKALYSQYAQDVGYDLTGLNLTQEKDGVKMTITGANFRADVNRLEFLVNVEGNFANSPYQWMVDPVVTINGYRAANAGGGMSGDDTPTQYDVCPPLNISEFGKGEVVVFELPLYSKGANIENTNYPDPTDVLRYEFTIDKSTLQPMTVDKNGVLIAS